MRTMLGAVIGWVLVAGIARGQAPHGLQPALDDLLPAANAHDTDRFLAPYSRDSTIVLVSDGAVITGFANIRDLRRKAWAKTDVFYSQQGPMSVVPLTPEVVVVTDPLSTTRTLPDGEVKTVDVTVTMVWQQRPEGWRVVHIHESTAR